MVPTAIASEMASVIRRLRPSSALLDRRASDLDTTVRGPGDYVIVDRHLTRC